MLTEMVIVEWPSVRDVARELDVSTVRVNQLIHADKLHVVRTRLGYLISPASVAEYADARRRGEVRTGRRRVSA